MGKDNRGETMASIARYVRSTSLPFARNIISSHLRGPAAAAAVEGSRTFATEEELLAPKSKIKLPKPVFGPTGKYVSALYRLAAEQNALEKVESELKAVVEATKKDENLKSFMKDITIAKKQRVKLVSEIFAPSGLSDITKHLLKTLAHDGRLKFLEPISKKYFELTMAQRGDVKVMVTIAYPFVDEKEEEDFKKTVEKTFRGEKGTVIMETKIDPTILDGMMFEWNGKLLDMSIKTRAKQMEQWLMKTYL